MFTADCWTWRVVHCSHVTSEPNAHVRPQRLEHDPERLGQQSLERRRAGDAEGACYGYVIHVLRLGMLCVLGYSIRAMP